jgi:hypothetical protein
MITTTTLLILTGYSIVSVITESYLFRGLRRFIEKRNINWGQFINCQLCVSIWVSFALTFIVLPHINADYLLRFIYTFSGSALIMFVFYFERFLVK